MSNAKFIPVSSLLLVACLVAVCKATATSSSNADNVSYAGYTLLKAKPQNLDQLHQLIELQTSQEFRGVDFWLPPTIVGRDVSILVDPESKASVIKLLESKHISAAETIGDVGEEIRKSRSPNVDRQFEFLGFGYGQRPQPNSNRIPQLKDTFFADYQRYETIEKRLVQYSSRPQVETRLLGYSSQNRSIYLVKVSSDPSKNNPVILIDAGHHAREWISHSTIMFMIDNLLRPRQGANGSSNNGLASKLNDYDLWFVPTVNPDGYEYSHTHDRMWRKTRSRGRVCEGADPNRNYNDHWGGNGSSRDECSLIYAGKRAESEIEVKHVANLLYANRQRIVMYLSLHSFSQMILWPYGYANVAPSNEKQLRSVASAGVAAIRQYRGTSYSMGRVANVLYPASGGSDDYAMGACGIPFAYTIELPDKGWRGFILPSSEIIPVGVETEQGIAAMIDKMGEFL